MLQDLLEEKKRIILEKEARQFSTKSPLFQEWKERHSGLIAYLSSSRLYIPKLKLKVIDRTIQAELVSDIEALRLILEEELNKIGIKKIHYKTDFHTANRLYFPYLWRGGFYENCVKIDIKSCFYAIYSRLGIDCKIVSDIDHEKRYIDISAFGKGLIDISNPIISMLSNYKHIRNSVYGLTRASFYTLLHPSGKHERKFFRGRLQNLDLSVSIASLLHFIVYAFKDDILYWNIDGGIVKEKVAKKLISFIHSCGLQCRIEAVGEAHILGLGSYRVGNFSTLHYDHGVCSERDFYCYLYKVKGIDKILTWLK